MFGTTIGERYQIVEKLASGGFGEDPNLPQNQQCVHTANMQLPCSLFIVLVLFAPHGSVFTIACWGGSEWLL